ncbi:MAG: hypothetical protein JSU03_05575 [Bacteroidetes bacterium]|nr:hypothetical protein [Bacteroidota bacterium]
MCIVSDKLKLCTCKTENVEQFKHYWILYKYQKSGIDLVGIPMLPQEWEIGKETDEYNYRRLEKMLNAESCFDIDIELRNKDILEMHFSCNKNSDSKYPIHLVYEFAYKNKKWRTNAHDPFDTDRLEKHKGKIVNPFSI